MGEKVSVDLCTAELPASPRNGLIEDSVITEGKWQHSR